MRRVHKSIDYRAEGFLNDLLCEVIYHHITGDNRERYYDNFRGSLNAFFHLGMLAFDRYIFLVNFIWWLEYPAEFSENDDDMFQYFYDTYVKNLKEYQNRE